MKSNLSDLNGYVKSGRTRKAPRVMKNIYQNFRDLEKMFELKVPK